MEKEKVIGQYCKFLKVYVPVRYRYPEGGNKETACGKSGCGNAHCALSEQFKGSPSDGQNYLE